MTTRPTLPHLSAEQAQALAAGELTPDERVRAEAHVRSCPACAAEGERWRALFARLEEVGTLSPRPGFADQVLEQVVLPRPRSLAARARARVAALLRRPGVAHPAPASLQDYIFGRLPRRRAARIATHLDACAACAAETGRYRTVFAALSTLGHLEPALGFSAAVLSRVRTPAVVPARRDADWRRALAWAGRAVPRTRRAWAAVSGFAVTPVVTLGLVLWSVFSHPSLTLGSLASFAAWQLADLATAAWGLATASATQSVGVFGVFSAAEALALTPSMLLGGFAALSVGTIAAVWILYRNMFAPRHVDGRYVETSLS